MVPLMDSRGHEIPVDGNVNNDPSAIDSAKEAVENMLAGVMAKVESAGEVVTGGISSAYSFVKGEAGGAVDKVAGIGSSLLVKVALVLGLLLIGYIFLKKEIA